MFYKKQALYVSVLSTTLALLPFPDMYASEISKYLIPAANPERLVTAIESLHFQSAREALIYGSLLNVETSAKGKILQSLLTRGADLISEKQDLERKAKALEDARQLLEAQTKTYCSIKILLDREHGSSFVEPRTWQDIEKALRLSPETIREVSNSGENIKLPQTQAYRRDPES